MSEVLTANILLSLDITSIENIFESGDAGDLQDYAETNTNSTFIFQNLKDSPFLKLTHSLGMGAGENHGVVTLEFVDPTNKFEERFFSLSYPEQVRNKIKPSLKSMKDIEGSTKLSVGGAERDFESPGFRELEQDNFVKFLGNLNKEMGSLDAHHARHIPMFGKLVVAYGVGRDLGAWAGPFTLYLTGADYDYRATGPRIIRLRMAPMSLFPDVPDILGGDLIVDSLGVPEVYVGHTGPCNFSDRKDMTEAGIGHTTVHSAFKQALKSYIAKLGQFNSGNIFVILPDLDKLLFSKDRRAGLFETFFTDLGLDRVELMEDTSEETTPYFPGPVEEQEGQWDEWIKVTTGWERFWGSGRSSGMRFPEYQIVWTSEKSAKYPKPIDLLLDKESKNTAGIMDALKYKLASSYPLEIISHYQVETKHLEKKEIQDKVQKKGDPILIFGDRALIKKLLYTNDSLGDLSVHENDEWMHGIFATDPEEEAKVSYPFGDPNKRPDRFSLLESADINELEMKVAEVNVPVFKSGISNSNILQLNVKTENIYYLHLFNSFRTALKTQTLVGQGPQPDLDAFSDINKDLLKEFLIIAGTLLVDSDSREEAVQKLSVMFQGSMAFGEAKADNLALSIISSYVIAAEGDDKNDSKIINIVDDAMKAMMSSARKIDDITGNTLSLQIDTLPMFHLSSPSILAGQTCMVFILEALSQGLHYLTSFKKINHWLTGLYTITGFQHTISPTSMQSQFNLIKNVRTTTTEDAQQHPETEESPLQEEDEHAGHGRVNNEPIYSR